MPGPTADTLDRRDRDLLSELAAAPRPAGSRRLAGLRVRCADELRAMGFEVREKHFDYSTLPGRFGTPMVGALAMGVVAVASHWGARGARVVPLVALLAGGLLLLFFGRWLQRTAVLNAPWMRASGVNLEATRSRNVSVWLCAHLDSKSQPVPTLVRSAGIIVQAAGTLVTLALAVAAAVGSRPPFGAWAAAAIVTLLGAIPVVLSVVGSRSPGALDNASGVVTVMAAARRLAGREGVGVVITDAEELGLAGAHAWARAHLGAVVLNCDGVDDSGTVMAMYSGRAPAALLEIVGEASRDSGIAVATRRLPLGMLTDSVAVGQRGGTSITFSRGTVASLLRVHSERDDLEHLSGAGIPDTAGLMAGAARRLAELGSPRTPHTMEE